MLKPARKVKDRKRGRERIHRVLEGQPDAGNHCTAFDGGASTDNVPAITDTVIPVSSHSSISPAALNTNIRSKRDTYSESQLISFAPGPAFSEVREG